MNYLFLGLLITFCSFMITWGLQKRDRIYQYPFLVAGCFFVFVIPQAISLTNHPGNFTSDLAVGRLLLMCCLCVLASWIGYLLPIPKRWLLTKPLDLNQNSLQNISIVYVFLGIIFNIVLFWLPGEGDVKITGQATGIFTIYIFLMRGFLYIGFPIVLINAIKNFTIKNCFLIIFALSVPFYQAVFLGRRSSFALLIFSIAIGLYFVRKVLPYRSLAIFSIIFALIVSFNIREYRNALIDKDWRSLEKVEYLKTINNFVSQEQEMELRNAALLMNFTAERGNYGWGTGYWDQLVFSFIPGQIFGKKFKNSLGIYKTTRDIHLKWAYGYRTPTGSTITGMAEAFTQFDYFGCLLFALSAILCKWLWLRSLVWNNVFEQCLYINIIQGAVIGVVVTGHSILLVQIIAMTAFSLPIFIFCRRKITYLQNIYTSTSTLQNY